MKIRWFFLLCALQPGLGAQVPGVVDEGVDLPLEKALAKARSQGFETKILGANLDTAEANANAAVARNGFGLSAGGGYTTGVTLGDSVSAAKLAPGAVENLSHSFNGSLTGTLGGSKAVLSGSHSFIPDSKGTLNQSSSVSLALTQTLWDGYLGGQGQAALDKSLNALEIQRLTALSSRSSLTAKVKTAYFTAATAEENLKILQQSLAQKRFILTLIQARYDLQQASSIDLKDAQINYKTAELDYKAGEMALKTARSRLGVLLGEPLAPFIRLVNEDPQPTDLKDLEEALKVAQNTRPDLKILTLNQKTAAIDQALANGQVWPSVSLSAGATLSQDWATSKGAQYLNAGVKLGLPVVDGGLTLSLISAAAKQNEAFALQQEALIKSLATEVEDAFVNFQIRFSRWELAQLSLEKLQAQYDIIKTKNEAGSASFQDMMTAELNLSTGKLNLAKAKIDAKLAQVTLDTVVGR